MNGVQQISLRGYRLPGGDPRGQVQTGYIDKELSALRERFVHDGGVIKTWGFHATTFEIAVRLLGRNFSSWLTLQAMNPYVYGRNADFLRDCVEFILTGHRRMTTMTWNEMLAQDIDAGQQLGRPDATRFNSQITALERSLGNATSATVLDAWVSHPHGFRDFLGSLMIFYGTQRIIL